MVKEDNLGVRTKRLAVVDLLASSMAETQLRRQ